MSTQSQQGQVYRLIVRGELGDRFAGLFGDMRLERVGGNTVLTGRVIDQAHLHGIIARTQDLGLELVIIEEVSEPTEVEGSQAT